MHKTLLAACFLLSLPLVAQNEFLKPEGLSPAPGYTHVVVTRPGKLIYVSGQVGADAAGKILANGDLKGQLTQVFENLKTALKAAGATFDDVVKINWYIKDYKPEYLPLVREIRDKYVNRNNPPASTLVGVQSLAREEFLVEVEATAVIPYKPKRK